jgi:tetratricopeptide (TPR) repeat protein
VSVWRWGLGKRAVLIVGGLAVSVLVVWLAFANPHRDWTTSKPEALAEFEKGLDAQGKIYAQEAHAHFTRALELDPSFAMAKLFTLMSGEKQDNKKKLIDELLGIDPASLTRRERFLLAYYGATSGARPADPNTILKDYLAEDPDDPFALDIQGRLAVSRQDWETAQKVFARLIEVAPNRVEAYNQLGYLAIAQERFKDAENMFRTYRYLAPDQANPRDSLGELLALTGHYAEAEREFAEALRVKPDFCVSVEHIIVMSFLDLDVERGTRALSQAKERGACSQGQLQSMECILELLHARATGNWDLVWRAGLGRCSTSATAGSTIRFWAALLTNRKTEADASIARTREKLAAVVATSPAGRMLGALISHMEGAELLVSGQPAQAATRFASTDRELLYRGLDDGSFKLINRQTWVIALAAAGQRAEAARVAAELAQVNPNLAPLGWSPNGSPSHVDLAGLPPGRP